MKFLEKIIAPKALTMIHTLVCFALIVALFLLSFGTIFTLEVGSGDVTEAVDELIDEIEDAAGEEIDDIVVPESIDVSFPFIVKSVAGGVKAAGALIEILKDTAEDVKSVKLSTNYAAAVMEDGKVVAAILDTAEPELKEITENGAASLAFGGSKRALGENYGAMPAGTWYVQADAYVLAAYGLTVDNIASLASEGVAGCTIYAGGYKACIEAAVKAGR